VSQQALTLRLVNLGLIAGEQTKAHSQAKSRPARRP
jgi:hypothetical protein